jgi:hypothetical protein
MKHRLDKRYRRYIQSFFLVLPMTGIVTAVNTIVARGLEAVLTAVTLKKWGISILVAFPAVLCMQPLAAKITAYLIKADQE